MSFTESGSRETPSSPQKKQVLQSCLCPRPYLFTEWCPPRTLGLLVALWQRSVAGAQTLTRRIVNLHGNALGGSFLGEGFQMYRLLIAQKVFKPIKQFRELPEKPKQKQVNHQRHAPCGDPVAWPPARAGSERCAQGQFPNTCCLKGTDSGQEVSTVHHERAALRWVVSYCSVHLGIPHSVRLQFGGCWAQPQF